MNSYHVLCVFVICLVDTNKKIKHQICYLWDWLLQRRVVLMSINDLNDLFINDYYCCSMVCTSSRLNRNKDGSMTTRQFGHGNAGLRMLDFLNCQASCALRLSSEHIEIMRWCTDCWNVRRNDTKHPKRVLALLALKCGTIRGVYIEAARLLYQVSVLPRRSDNVYRTARMEECCNDVILFRMGSVHFWFAVTGGGGFDTLFVLTSPAACACSSDVHAIRRPNLFHECPQGLSSVLSILL